VPSGSPATLTAGRNANESLESLGAAAALSLESIGAALVLFGIAGWMLS
jgi:hypothetical protein